MITYNREHKAILISLTRKWMLVIDKDGIQLMRQVSMWEMYG